MNRLFLGFVLICSPCLLLAQEENSNRKVVDVRIAILQSNSDLELNDGARLSVKDFDELITNLRKQNTLEHYQFFNLTSLEAQEASIQSGQEEPIVTGKNIPAEERVQKAYRKQTGNTVKVKPRVRDDGKIFVELDVRSCRLIRDPMPESDARDESGPFAGLPGLRTIGMNTTKLVESGVNTVIALPVSKTGEETKHAYIIIFATTT
jgi:hypothetical protein